MVKRSWMSAGGGQRREGLKADFRCSFFIHCRSAVHSHQSINSWNHAQCNETIQCRLRTSDDQNVFHHLTQLINERNRRL